MNAYEAVVVGGGHHRLLAAVELADHGRQVLLCESPPAVGGAVADRTIGDFFVDEFSQESSWLRAPSPPHLEFDGHFAITRCVPCDGPLPDRSPTSRR